MNKNRIKTLLVASCVIAAVALWCALEVYVSMENTINDAQLSVLEVGSVSDERIGVKFIGKVYEADKEIFIPSDSLIKLSYALLPDSVKQWIEIFTAPQLRE